MRPSPFEWVESQGGPVILLPTRLLPEWGGADRAGASPWGRSAPESDYGRACSAGGSPAIVQVAHGQGLVIGGEPLPITAVPSADGWALVRWVFADSDDDVAAALSELDPATFSAVEGVALSGGEEFRLFDAAMPGDDIVGTSLSLDLGPGPLHVYTSELHPSGRTKLIVHWLGRQLPG